MRIYYTLEQQLRHMKRRLSIVERVAGKAAMPVEHVALQILDTEDLNDVFDAGTYVQRANVNTSGARHYPFNRAGWLEVVDASHVGTQGFVFQTYQEYGQSGAQQVRRAWRSWYGSWSAWRIEGQNEITRTGSPGVVTYVEPGWSLQKAQVIENAGVAHIFLAIVRTGGDISSGGNVNMGDVYMCRFNSRYWSTLGEDFDVLLTQSGLQSFVARVRSSGEVDLTHATSGGQTLASGTQLRCQFTVVFNP